ncbi:MAG: hypothetical protein M3P30_08915 [Chloroflexota bacterium]|nr:hypothetical protein [Chloroflexota bacterium]
MVAEGQHLRIGGDGAAADLLRRARGHGRREVGDRDSEADGCEGRGKIAGAAADIEQGASSGRAERIEQRA